MDTSDGIKEEKDSKIVQQNEDLTDHNNKDIIICDEQLTGDSHGDVHKNGCHSNDPDVITVGHPNGDLCKEQVNCVDGLGTVVDGDVGGSNCHGIDVSNGEFICAQKEDADAAVASGDVELSPQNDDVSDDTTSHTTSNDKTDVSTGHVSSTTTNDKMDDVSIRDVVVSGGSDDLITGGSGSGGKNSDTLIEENVEPAQQQTTAKESTSASVNDTTTVTADVQDETAIIVDNCDKQQSTEANSGREISSSCTNDHTTTMTGERRDDFEEEKESTNEQADAVGELVVAEGLNNKGEGAAVEQCTAVDNVDNKTGTCPEQPQEVKVIEENCGTCGSEEKDCVVDNSVGDQVAEKVSEEELKEDAVDGKVKQVESERNNAGETEVQGTAKSSIDLESGDTESDSNRVAESERDSTVSGSKAENPSGKDMVMMREKGGRKEEDKTPVNVEFGIEVFGKMQEKAEQRLAQRRQAREEARQIRMRELEKQQRDMEEKQDRIYELTKDSSTTTRSYQGSRRGSDDSTSSEDTRELKKLLAEMEEKYKKAMMNNAQLDNEKQTYRYQVDELKDNFVELEENYTESQRLLKERCRELEQKKRDHEDLLIECDFHKVQVTERDKLIQEYGLVFISNDAVEDQEDKKNTKRRRKKKETEDEQKPALVTRDALQILASVGGSLDEKVKQLSEENKSLENELKKLRLQFDEEKEKNALAEKFNSPKHSSKESTSNGPIDNITIETNLEAQKQLTEYRYKLKKAEQDITVLEGNVIRLESQVKRYKSTAEESEKAIEEMKSEKRKVQREMRESQNQIAELESQNNHLQKRLEKFKKERMDAIISGKS